MLLRTESCAKLFPETQLHSTNPATATEMFLQPEQATITSIIDSSVLPKFISYYLKLHIVNFFNTTVDSSKLCNGFLHSIVQTRENYQLIHSALKTFTDGSSEEISSNAVAGLDSLIYASGKPFLQSNTRRVQFDPRAVGRGTYILNRDFQTTSRLVVRLYDEVEHISEMVKFFLQKKGNKFPLMEMVNQLRRSGSVLRLQIDELEEQVRLCLPTINMTRVLVISEISAT